MAEERVPVPIRSAPHVNAPASPAYGNLRDQRFVPWPFPTRIKYKGVFDFRGLYRSMAKYLKDRRFELHERLYKAKPPELEIRWFADRKQTALFLHRIEVYFHLWDFEEVEVIISGIKRTRYKGRMVLSLTAMVSMDYADIYGNRQWNSNIARRIMGIYSDWVVKQDINLLHQDALYYEVLRFQAVIKDFLKLEGKGNLY